MPSMPVKLPLQFRLLLMVAWLALPIYRARGSPEDEREADEGSADPTML